MARKYSTNASRELIAVELPILGGEENHALAARANASTSNSPFPGIKYVSPVQVQTNYTPKIIIPWGPGNNQPEFLLELVTNNPAILGIMSTKAAILNGEGPTLHLCSGRGEEKTRERLYLSDLPAELEDFFEYNNLHQATFEGFLHGEILNSRFWLLKFTQGSSQVSRRIYGLERLDATVARAIDPKHDEEAPDKTQVHRYVVWPEWNPTGQEQAKYYKRFSYRSFYNASGRWEPGRETAPALVYHMKRDLDGWPHYPPPGWIGARFYLELQNEIPKWHIANLMNQFSVRVVVSVNEGYLRSLEQMTNPATKKNFSSSEARQFISDLVRDHMTKPENAGRPLLLTHSVGPDGKPIPNILIETISLDLKDEAFVKQEDPINNKVTSSMGIDPSLAGIITSKGLSSGAEKRDAWNIEVAKAQAERQRMLSLLQFVARYNNWNQYARQLGGEYLEFDFPTPKLVTEDKAPQAVVQPDEPTEP